MTQPGVKRDVAIAVVLPIAVMLPILVWARFDTGVWLPQTMQAKAAWFAEGCRPWQSKLSTTVEALRNVFSTSQLIVFVVALVPLARTRLGRFGLSACAMILLVYAAVFPGALFHNYYRYTYAILLPWLVLGMGFLFTWIPA